ncbi:MAG: galactosylceramidase [Bacteroidota bacterium]
MAHRLIGLSLKILATIFLASVLCFLFVTASRPRRDVQITLDSRSPGRVFEGIGALSAGASSRLLIDYPEPQRSDILDLLFKPKFAASFQHLKVEIGGDINSTDGSEPGFARTRQEFLNPSPKYFDRGYEWWLMKEAKRRNPDIVLDILQWGAPPWIGDQVPGLGQPQNKRFYSQDNADLIVSFIRGAKKFHGLTIDYCGIWNETPYDIAWIKLLRRTLDAAGLTGVKIVAADQTPDIAPEWKIAEDIVADDELARSVYTIGAHYASSPAWKFALKEPFASTEEAKKTGKPLWASEDGPWRGDWEGARFLAKLFNRSYAVGRMTKTVIWSLITSYYDNLPIPGSGPMRANKPWSGSYDVQPAIWAIAHTTQFVQPGWRYMDSACGLLGEGGSYVSLRDSSGADWSIIAETMDAKGPQTLSVRISEGLSTSPLSVRRTNEGHQFEELAPVQIVGGEFRLTLEPNTIYSLSTKGGQQKGERTHPVSHSSDFASDYREDFEGTSIGKAPRYLSDLNGAFEVVRRPDGNGRSLKQVVMNLGIEWPLAQQPSPRTIVGSKDWKDYEIVCNVLLEENGWIGIGVRFDKPWDSGYWLQVTNRGEWKLLANGRALAEGIDTLLVGGRWHRLGIRCRGDEIVATVGKKELASVRDTTFKSGMAILGTGWNSGYFDNLEIHPLHQ